jgi:hypothetical protein
MALPEPPGKYIKDIQGKIEIVISGERYTAEIEEAWTQESPATDTWAAAAKIVGKGNVWTLNGMGPTDAVARCLAIAVSAHEVGE